MLRDMKNKLPVPSYFQYFQLKLAVKTIRLKKAFNVWRCNLSVWNSRTLHLLRSNFSQRILFFSFLNIGEVVYTSLDNVWSHHVCRALPGGEVGLYPGCEEEMSSHCSYSHHCCCARRSFTVSVSLAQEVKLILREIRYTAQLPVWQLMRVLQVHDKTVTREGRGGHDNIWLEVRCHGHWQILPDRTDNLHSPDHTDHVHISSPSHCKITLSVFSL